MESAGSAAEIGSRPVTFRLSPAVVLAGVEIRMEELHIEGPVRYARITTWVDRDGRELPEDGRFASRLEIRPTEPESVTLRNVPFPYRPQLMGEIWVEDAHGRRTRQVWRIHG